MRAGSGAGPEVTRVLDATSPRPGLMPSHLKSLPEAERSLKVNAKGTLITTVRRQQPGAGSAPR